MYTWDKRKIGRNLKLIRVKRDISQMELSKALGIAQGHYSNIESGKRQLSLRLLAKICEMFGVNPSDIIADRDDDGDSAGFDPETAAEKEQA
ncbi:helix-turn-helix domain-containing protein [Acetomicrobium mobile]|uniref:helix-turn-helix domain-containing protein n=1 Tax=Acetomicrobium mobile TaxID=97477 RepID=UPI0026EC64E2|nr:helix-turn-helix transcriptional regulator [Acetomicrobium mobile]